MSSSPPSSSGLKPQRFGDAISFAQLAKAFETLSKLKTPADRHKKLDKVMLRFREHFKDDVHGTLDSEEAGGDSLFPIIRLLIPKEDRKRATYCLQTTSLGRILAETLGLSGPDKEKLENFKQGQAKLDFGSLVQSVMKKRFRDAPDSKITITGINDALDKMGRPDGVVKQADQKKILLELFTRKKMPPLEAKWLCRLLLKNLELGLSKNKILDLLHPKAKEMYSMINDLEEVCKTLNNPEDDPTDVKKIKMFFMVKPMLCQRITTFDIFEADKSQARASTSSGSPVAAHTSKRQRGKHAVDLDTYMAPPYVVEIKWDGERFQIHYDGERWKYMSKSGKDYTENFRAPLTSKLKPLLKSGVQSFIIDAEMMAWHKRDQTFTQKGGQTDVKHLTLVSEHTPVLVIFDILLLNGEIVIDKPLHERMKLVKNVFTPKDQVVLIPEPKVLQSKEQVEEALNEAIDNREEGLVVKTLDSKYIPGYRGLHWRKVKPEFIFETSVTDLDLLIVGAYYSTTSRRAGTISHFLVAAIDDKSLRNGNEKFYPLAQVGSGHLGSHQLKSLVEELKPLLVKKEFPNVDLKVRKRPDLFINPKNSIVVQVKASEIVKTSEYHVGYTLRFPRITSVRKDKRYNDIETLSQFHALRESTSGKLAKKTNNNTNSRWKPNFVKRKIPRKQDDDDSESDSYHTSDDEQFPQEQITSKKPSPTKTKIEQIPATVPSKQPLVLKDIFQSKIFCVYGPTAFKSKMEKDIQSYGGQITKNPLSKDKTYIVGNDEENLKIKQAIKAGSYDVLKPQWIEGCLKDGKLLKVQPTDFFYYTKTTGESFLEDFDEFGDSWNRPISLEEAKDLIKKKVTPTMKKLNEKEYEGPIPPKRLKKMEELDEEDLFPGGSPRIPDYFRFFKDVVAAFRGPGDPVLSALIEFYGGTVLDSEKKGEDLTHVIVQDPLSPTKKKQYSAILVKPSWIRDCVERRELLEERKYFAGTT